MNHFPMHNSFSQDDFDRLLKEALHTESVLPIEKHTAMRSLLKEYAAFKPVRVSGKHSRWAYLLERIKRHSSSFIGFSTAFALLLVGGGVAFASTNTVPGDFLYPVKIDVVELVQTALIFSPSAKASWQMTLAERRVDETAKLANDGKLSTTTAAQLSARFAVAADVAAQIIVAQVKGPDANRAVVSAASFSDMLSGYETVLGALVQHKPSDYLMAELRGAIRARIAVFSTLAALDESATPTVSTTSTQRSDKISAELLFTLRDAANRSLNDSVRALAAASSTLTTNSSNALSSVLGSATHDIEHANALLQQHNDVGAVQAFQNALSITSQLQILTYAAVTFKLNVLKSTTTSATTSMAATSSHSTVVKHAESNVVTSPSIPALPLEL